MEEGATLGDFVAKHGRNITLQAGQVLFREGDSSSSVYACVKGRINLFVTTPAGREVILGIKVPHQGFGELSAIDGAPRSATAVAIEPTVVSLLSADEFLERLDKEPRLAATVLRELSDHLRRLNARIAARSSENTTTRVASLLVELTEKFRRHGAAASATELPITQDEVASWVGSTREAAARSLAQLRKAGAIETGRNRITVIDFRCLLEQTEV